MVQSPREVVERWFVALWRDRDPSVIPATRAETSTSRGLAPELLVGVEQYRAFYARAAALLSDTDVRFDVVVEQGDTVAAHLTITGKVRGKPVEVSGAVFARVVDGRLVEARNLFDVAGFLAQVGRDQPGSMAEAIASLEATS